MNSNEQKLFEIIRKIEYIGDVVNCIEDAYITVKDLKNFDEEKFISCASEYISESELVFISDELIRDFLTYYIEIDEYDFYNILNTYTDYNTSEIRTYATYHCEKFDVKWEDC